MASPETTAFVLAGGGAKGAFEAGALLYLVEEQGIVPDILTATSAGSVCAAVLAQARTHEEMVMRARELRQDLLALTRADVVFGKQPWVAALDGTVFGRAIDRLVVERTRPPVPGGTQRRVHRPARSAGVGRWLEVATDVARALTRLRHVRAGLRGRTGSLLTLDPLAAALTPTPAGRDVRRVAGLAPIDPALVARPGLELRLAVVALGAGALRYVSGQGRLVEADARTPVPGKGGGPVDLVEAVVASASVPMIFPPRPMADDVYVDGGVVCNVPVEAAANLGARRIFAVLAVPLEQPPDPTDFTRASGVSVFLRSVGAIAFAERQRADLRPPVPPGTDVTVIDPRVDVVGPFEVSPGLMRLDMDYGWMRAADVLADVDHSTRRQAAAATDAVAEARTQAWHREEAIWSAGWASVDDLATLATVKVAVRDAVLDRKGLGLPTPDGAEQWWTGYEAHDLPQPAGLPDDASRPLPA